MKNEIVIPVLPEDKEVLPCLHCQTLVTKHGDIKFYREETGGKTSKVICSPCYDKGLRYNK